MSTPTMTVAFLNTGQGDSTAIILPDHTNALVVDCCRDSVMVDYLEQNRIKSLKQVFLTHTDMDHISGILGVLENFSTVDTILYNHDFVKFVEDKPRIKSILRQLAALQRQHGWTFQFPHTGQTWIFQDVGVEVLHPAEEDKRDADFGGDGNNVSVVLRITFAGSRVLLTGDIAGQGWQWLMERKTDLKSDVLKFPHHGAWYIPESGQPSLDKAIEKVAPDLVVISVGTNNSYNHPGTKTFHLLSKSKLRLVCTQATYQCHAALLRKRESQTCAGTVEVKISKDGREVFPDSKTHEGTIRRFSSQKCRK